MKKLKFVVVLQVIGLVSSVSFAEQNQSSQPMIQTATRVYHCIKTKEYAGGVRPDAELRLKIIRIADGVIISDDLIGNYDSTIGGGGTTLGQCQARAAQLNSVSY